MLIERKLQKATYVVLLMLLSLLITTSSILIQSSSELTLNQHWISSEDDLLSVEQIFINGNSEFHLRAQQYGWPGQGTFGDPILIKHMNFSKNANMFSVSNTDLHFQFAKNRLDGIARGWCAIVLYNVSNAIISDNDIFNAAVGVHAIRLSESLITNNHVYLSGVGVTIENNSHDNMISHNFFDNLSVCGVWSIEYSHNNTYYGNEIKGGWEGINIARDSVYNTISNNLIYNCDDYGVWLMTENNSVIHNEIHSISGNGVSVWNSGNEIVGNLIYNNSDCGIVLKSGADSTTIQNNTVILNSPWALVIESGHDNTVEHNDFLENEEPDQVCDDGEGNIFSSNYWHMWIGSDLNSDDIIDTPYTINGTGNGVDNSPVSAPNTELPDWYCFSPITQSSEPTSTSSESTVGVQPLDISPELALGVGLIVTGIIILSYFTIRKHGI